MDVDPNYDPSDFLLAGLPSRDDKSQVKIQDDLDISESDEEDPKSEIKSEKIPAQTEEEMAGDLWF